MRKRRLGVGITFSTNFDMYEQIRNLAIASEMSSSEFIRNVLEKHLAEINEKGGSPIED